MNLISTSKAAMVAHMQPDTVRYHAKKGHLLSIKVDRGNGRFQRLFLEEDVERFAREREQGAKEKTHAVEV